MTSPTPNYEFHPLADTFPMIEKDELRELANDIQRLGLREPIVLFEGKILDGRNRYRAAMGIKFPLTPAHFKTLPPDADPQAFVISANIHRRHLSPDQRRALLVELIKADPSKSNRQVAETARVSHHTVGDVRAELEATGQIAQLETTTGADGKNRKTKAGKTKEGKAKDKKQTAQAATKAYHALQEKLVDALSELKEVSSFAHAEEYAEKTKERLDQAIDGMRKEEKKAA
jgi:ParB-like chromosome segregation protein Spo0J